MADAKSSEAYRTISEVSEEIAVPQHVLRFWETKFTEIKPLKRGGNRRYYRPDDVALVRAVNRLLYTEGYTIRGVQKLLKDRGVRAVVAGEIPPSESVAAAEPQPAAIAPLFDAPPAFSAAQIGELRAIRELLASALREARVG